MKHRYLVFHGALLGCVLLLASSSSSPLAAASAASGALAEREAAVAASSSSSSSLPSSFPSPRRLGGARALTSLSSSSRRHREAEENDRRSSSFSILDGATAPTTTTTTTTETLLPPRSFHNRPRLRSSSPSIASSSSSPNPKIDLYVRTFRGDAAWLTWLLRSIEENVEETAFRKLIVSVPRNDSRLFESLLPSFRLPIVLLIVDDARFERATKAMKSRTQDGGYHAQMFDKLSRPPLFSDADFFVHVDSDCVFKRQLVGEGSEELPSSSSYRKISRLDFVDALGRVRVRRVAFASLPRPFRRWQSAAEGMLLEAVPFETMSCFPLVFPREVYGLVRELVLGRHGGEVLQEEGESGSGGGGGRSRGDNNNNNSNNGSSSSSHLFFRILSQHLDDFGEFTAMGHVLTTRLKEGERWISDFEGEGEGKNVEGPEEEEEGKKKIKVNAPPLLLSTPTSSSTKSFCSLTQQAWSWGSVTPEAAVAAERSLRAGW